MANEYVTLEELKAQFGIEPSDDTEDVRLNRARASASTSINTTCGRRFWLDPEPVQRRFNPRGRIVRETDGELFLVDDIGSLDGLLVESGSGSSWSAVTGYETSPDNALVEGKPVTGLMRVSGTWGLSTSRLRLTAQFGWPAVPEDIHEAALILATRLFKRKDSPEGIIGSAEWGVRNLSRRDPDVWNLIEPYIIPGF
ncbi:phage gp6-like head-tail connector protein [Streptomyces phaeochromogenes]|uniref:phage gp6-like head-tail connector protein n=1 Tax=Streptomyces phaeochromogenes TaxID=1923 RepID=UPI002DD96E75|nr:phage gp6-like head-tail connector protein [Streptomyces phaeochromogenes]WRZ31340.1 phage head-tail connector protein [Streptomyces phaeochromogenes]